MQKTEIELTSKQEPSEKETQYDGKPFDPENTVLPVKDLKSEAFVPECYRLHDDDWVGHGWNHTEETGGGPKVKHYNIKTQKFVAKYEIPEFFDEHWFAAFSHIFNFKFENEGEQSEEKSRQIQNQKDFSAIFVMNKLGQLFMLPKVVEEHDEPQEVKPIRILEEDFCDPKKEKDERHPYTAAFALHENKIYIVTISRSR